MHGSFSVLSQISGLNPFDYEEVDIGAAAVGFTASKVNACKAVIVRFSGGDVRFTVHGVDPTGASGNKAYEGDREGFSELEAKQFKAIKDSGAVTNGTAHATFYK